MLFRSRYSTETSCKFGTPVSGDAYQNARKVTTEWNARPKHWVPPEFKMQHAPNVTKRPFSPPSFPARRKRRGRRRHVRNDHDGTNPCKQGFLSSVLVSSFPNRKLNLRFGFYRKSAATSQSRLRRASIPTPFVPSGHFPLIGGIGPWKGSLFRAQKTTPRAGHAGWRGQRSSRILLSSRMKLSMSLNCR